MEYDTIETLKAELRFMYARYEKPCIAYGELIKKNLATKTSSTFQEELNYNDNKGE